MRVLLISKDGIGAWFLLRLLHDGHDVDWHLLDNSQRHRRVLRGLVPPPLPEFPDPETYDLVVFDSTGNGELAEKVRAVSPVLGDGVLSSRLEDDRLFGINVMEQCGLEVPPYESFDSPDQARAFLKKRPARYVYKPFTPSGGQEQDTATTYVSDSPEDMELNLDQLFEQTSGTPFLLQEFIEGTECSTEGWFDGTQFHLHNHTLEEKKFLDNGVGPNTGCACNLVWATNGPTKLFQRTVQRLSEFLKAHNYRGMVDINTIVTPLHAYGLEFTPRFGYEGSCNLFSMLDGDLGQMFHQMVTATPSDTLDFRTTSKWAATVRYSIPPYPSEFPGQHPRDVPIKGVNLEDAWHSYFLYDAMMDGGNLVTAGVNGFVTCPIGLGHTPEGAWDAVEKMQKNIKIPNGQHRQDGRKATLKRLNTLKEQGWV